MKLSTKIDKIGETKLLTLIEDMKEAEETYRCCSTTENKMASLKALHQWIKAVNRLCDFENGLKIFRKTSKFLKKLGL